MYSRFRSGSRKGAVTHMDGQTYKPTKGSLSVIILIFNYLSLSFVIFDQNSNTALKNYETQNSFQRRKNFLNIFTLKSVENRVKSYWRLVPCALLKTGKWGWNRRRVWQTCGRAGNVAVRSSGTRTGQKERYTQPEFSTQGADRWSTEDGIQWMYNKAAKWWTLTPQWVLTRVDATGANSPSVQPNGNRRNAANCSSSAPGMCACRSVRPHSNRRNAAN